MAVKRLLNCLGQLQRQTNTTKTQFYLAVFGIIFFLCIALIISNYLMQKQHIYKTQAVAVSNIATLKSKLDSVMSDNNSIWVNGITNAVEGYNRFPAIQGQVDMYYATGDTSYISKALEMGLKYKSIGVDRNGDGYLEWCSPWINDYNHFHVEWRAGDGIATVVAAIYTDPNLASFRNADAAALKTLLENDVWKKWNLQNDPLSTSDATHMIGRKGLIALYLFQATGNTAYRDKAVAFGNFLKSYLKTTSAGGYNWTCTMIGDCDTGNTNSIDTSHGSDTVAFMVEMNRSGMVFDSTDMQKLVTTVKSTLWNQSLTAPAFASNVDGTGGYGNNGKFMGSWVKIGRFDAQLRDIFYNWQIAQDSTYFPDSAPFVRADVYGNLARAIKEINATAPNITSSPTDTCFYNSVIGNVTKQAYLAADLCKRNG